MTFAVLFLTVPPMAAGKDFKGQCVCVLVPEENPVFKVQNRYYHFKWFYSHIKEGITVSGDAIGG